MDLPESSLRLAQTWSGLPEYQPTAITERLTMLVLSTNNEPKLLVPILERPDAEAAVGAGSVSVIDWEDGDPFEVATQLLRSDGEFGISDSAWAMHLLGLQRALPGSRYRSLTESLPMMMRAVKDSNELMRLAAAGEAADSAYGEIVQRRFRWPARDRGRS